MKGFKQDTRQVRRRGISPTASQINYASGFTWSINFYSTTYVITRTIDWSILFYFSSLYFYFIYSIYLILPFILLLCIF